MSRRQRSENFHAREKEEDTLKDVDARMKKISLNSFRFGDCSNFPPKKEREEIEVQSFTSSSEMATSCEKKKPYGFFLMRELQPPPLSFSDMPPAHSTFVSKVVLFARQQHSTSPKTFWTMRMYYKVWLWRKGGKEEEPFVMHNFAFPSRRRPHKHKSPGQKKFRGKGEFIQKKKGGGREGGYFWNPCRPCLPALSCSPE